MKIYGYNDLAGCVQQRRARSTGTMVGVYHGDQSGIESDPTDPWVTVCEAHHNLMCHPTLALAKLHAAEPRAWCEDCNVSGPV